MDSTTASGDARLALVTGASKGLGKVVATFLAGHGYDLLLTARTAADLTETARDIEAMGFEGPVETVVGDVTDLAHRDALRKYVDERGGLDLLVNNASTLGPSPLPPLAEYPLADLEAVFETNAVAPLALIQALLPALAARSGLVVNITSDAGVEGYPGWGGYGASKAALELLSKTLAAELEGEVGVVIVDPGDMRTDMHQQAYPGEDITDRPLPDITLPFWGWLLGQDPLAINGRRFQAQADYWEAAP
ncbi:MULTISPECIES: SDR family oxidoreductase [unclassified Haladaptatus]|uniref:SDR family NAD(P)-dependent oxidoreductase n=1 Tax=unclassified Haladaptatus TaxID=2622732 RepID=UPI0023E89FC7|nr:MULTISPECIES: SDR family oxidoreductase [unclassified Haladaptatus]